MFKIGVIENTHRSYRCTGTWHFVWSHWKCRSSWSISCVRCKAKWKNRQESYRTWSTKEKGKWSPTHLPWKRLGTIWGARSFMSNIFFQPLSLWVRLLFFHVSCYQKTSNNSHQQVSKLNELAKKKVDLAKALIRAAEKNNKGSEGESSSSKKRKTGWNVGNLLRSKIWSPIGMYFVSLAMLLRTRCFLT